MQKPTAVHVTCSMGSACMRETTAARVREVNIHGEHQLELELTSHQRVSSGGVAVERGKEAAKREESPRTQHLSSRQALREDLRTTEKLFHLPLGPVPYRGSEPRRVIFGRGWNMAIRGGGVFTVFALYSATVLLLNSAVAHSQLLPVVINTWPFANANYKGVIELAMI